MPNPHPAAMRAAKKMVDKYRITKPVPATALTSKEELVFPDELARLIEQETQVGRLVEACEGLFKYVRDKYQIPPGQAFSCEHMRNIDRALALINGDQP